MLTAEQIAFRKNVIGGSDANTLMSGDDERITRLWREKRGEIEPEDLSGVLSVRMGSFTEPFNVQWFEEQTGRVVTHQGTEHLCIDYPFMALTADGLTDDGVTYFEAKHVSAFAKPEEIRARYYPQLQHAMIVLGLQQSVLSVFYGTMKYEFYDIALAPIYAEQLIDAESRFWDCVQSGEPPVVSHVAAPVEAIRRVDMSPSNEWGDSAAMWLETKAAAKKFEGAAKKLKDMIEADVIEAFGHGVKATRAKNNAITIREA
jgi:predicted phage-related endonuclease